MIGGNRLNCGICCRREGGFRKHADQNWHFRAERVTNLRTEPRPPPNPQAAPTRSAFGLGAKSRFPQPAESHQLERSAVAGAAGLRPGAGIHCQGLAKIGRRGSLAGAHFSYGFGAAFCLPQSNDFFTARPGIKIFLVVLDETADGMEFGSLSFTPPQTQRRWGVSKVSCCEACIHFFISLGQR